MITRELVGKINVNGRLFIERKGAMKPQECNYRERTCGDFCPHFGEPRSTDNSKDPEDDAKTELFICGGSVLIFDKLDDQRRNPADELHPYQIIKEHYDRKNDYERS